MIVMVPRSLFWMRQSLTDKPVMQRIGHFLAVALQHRRMAVTADQWRGRHVLPARADAKLDILAQRARADIGPWQTDLRRVTERSSPKQELCI
jgi:hypothetical protein